ncbi:MAG TPA: PilZ domain-containing protein [Gammaproteobacteria bacterium]
MSQELPKDRRDFPRIETEHSVEVVDADGNVFPTLALDLSLTGMQLLCDGPTAERIAPGGAVTTDGQPRELALRLRVRLHEAGRQLIGVRCQVMSLREVQADEFRIGVRFMRFDGDSYHALEAYIDESLPD